jgi:hypothetical protein
MTFDYDSNAQGSKPGGSPSCTISACRIRPLSNVSSMELLSLDIILEISSKAFRVRREANPG